MLHTPRSNSYIQIAENLENFKAMAKLVHMSQMVPGIKDADMAFMVLMECEMTGQTIFEWNEENHIICGRPSMKYDTMIAAFNSMPGCRVKLLEKTPERAALLLIDGEDEQEFSLTWQDAQREPWVYDGKESDNVAILAKGETPPRMKAKYATPRSRAIMLFARCVSDAIRTTRPEVTKGRYTPEEIEDFTVIDADSVTDVSQPKPIDIKKLTAPEAPKPKTASPEEPAATAPAAPAETEAEPAAELSSLAGQNSIDINSPIVTEQDTKIRRLLESLKKEGIDLIGPLKAKLKSSGINGLGGLTYGEADSLIAALERKEIENWAKQQIKGHNGPQ